MAIQSGSDLRKFKSNELSKIMRKFKLKGLSKKKGEKIQIIIKSNKWEQIKREVSIPTKPKTIKQLEKERRGGIRPSKLILTPAQIRSMILSKPISPAERIGLTASQIKQLSAPLTNQELQLTRDEALRQRRLNRIERIKKRQPGLARKALGLALKPVELTGRGSIALAKLVAKGVVGISKIALRKLGKELNQELQAELIIIFKIFSNNTTIQKEIIKMSGTEQEQLIRKLKSV